MPTDAVKSVPLSGTQPVATKGVEKQGEETVVPIGQTTNDLPQKERFMEIQSNVFDSLQAGYLKETKGSWGQKYYTFDAIAFYQYYNGSKGLKSGDEGYVKSPTINQLERMYGLPVGTIQSENKLDPISIHYGDNYGKYNVLETAKEGQVRFHKEDVGKNLDTSGKV